MKDCLIRAFARNSRVRIMIANTTNLVETARIKHEMWPTATAALGRTLTVASLMASTLKDEKETLGIQINGGGPIGTILVKAYSDLRVKGFVSDPEILLINNHTNKLDVRAAVGTNGYLKVVKDLQMKHDFSGQVELISGELGEDFAYYFNVSEQTPSFVSVGVLVGDENQVLAAGGLIIQMMPDAKEEDITYVESVVKDLKPMSTLINEGKTIEDIMNMLFTDVKILGEGQPYFDCDCSRERMLSALATIDKEEIKKMIEDKEGCETHCQFCNSYYQFNESELESLL